MSQVDLNKYSNAVISGNTVAPLVVRKSDTDGKCIFGKVVTGIMTIVDYVMVQRRGRSSCSRYLLYF